MLVATSTFAFVGGTQTRTLTLASAAQPDTLDPHRTSATSADAAASLQRLRSEAAAKADEFAIIDTIATPDPHTLVLTLSQPAPALLTSLASGWAAIVPATLIDAGHDFGNSPVGSGPFELQAWVCDGFVRLTANTDDDQGVPDRGRGDHPLRERNVGAVRGPPHRRVRPGGRCRDRAGLILDREARRSPYAQALVRLHVATPFLYLGTPYTTCARATAVEGFWITPQLDTFDFREVHID